MTYVELARRASGMLLKEIAEAGVGWLSRGGALAFPVVLFGGLQTSRATISTQSSTAEKGTELLWVGLESSWSLRGSRYVKCFTVGHEISGALTDGKASPDGEPRLG